MATPSIINPANDPIVEERIRRAIAGTPETLLTIGSSLASLPPAGWAGLLTAGQDPEDRPKGIMIDGQWQPSVVGDTPISPADAVNRVMDRNTFIPRSGAAQENLQDLGSAVETLMTPATMATDKIIQSGMENGIPVPGIALPLTILTAAAESIPTGRAGSTARQAGRASDIDMPPSGFGGVGDVDTRDLPLPGRVVPMDDPFESFNNMFSIAEEAARTDPNIAIGLDALRRGDELPAADPSLVDRSLTPMLTDEQVRQQMNMPIGSGRRSQVEQRLSSYDEMMGNFLEEPERVPAQQQVLAPIADRVDAERRWSEGEDLYAVHEMDEVPTKVTSRDMLNAYTPDQLYSTGKPMGQTGAGRSQRGSVEDTGGGQAVLGTQAARTTLLDLADQLPANEQARLTAKEKARVDKLVDKYPGLRPAIKYLTPDERRHLNSSRAEQLEQVWGEIDPSEMASVALAGSAKRGWYQRSGEAIRQLFGNEDAPRFAALLAATSPQTSVESNLRNSLSIWNEWDRAGRPTDPDAILEIMGRSVEGDKGIDSALGAWRPNTIRALSTDNPMDIRLSGPKVDSFMRNIYGDLREVTNDAWMAKFTGQDPDDLRGNINVAGTDPGKKANYLAPTVAARKAADLLTNRTGEKWTPAEVQETVWSWAMAIYEKADSDVTPIQNLIDTLSNADVYQTPDFANLLSQPGSYRNIVDQGDFGDGITRLEEFARRSGGSPVDPAAAASATAGIQPRHLRSAAERLERNRRTARKPKVLNDLRASVDRSIEGGQPGPYRGTAAPDSSRNVAQTIELRDPQRAQLMNSLGMSTPPVQELKPTAQSATKFLNSINRAKANNEWGAQVSAKSADEYRNTRMFLTEDGKAGFAIDPDGTIVSLFNAGNSKHEGISAHLVTMAIAQGGTKLDNYDTFLSKIYKRLGFEEKERFPWDESQKPDDWDYEQYKNFNDGRPDYVFMEYSPGAAE